MEERNNAPGVTVDDIASIQAQEQKKLEMKVLQGGIIYSARTFYGIAGFSAINSLAIAFGKSFNFVIGLGATQVIDGIVKKLGSATAIVGIPLNLIILGIYVALGYFASKRMRWAFIAGMVLYSLDSLIFLGVHDWLSFGFHMWMLSSMYRGLKIDTKLRQLEAQR